MRLSLILGSKHKFFKERNFVFDDPKFIGRFFKSYYVIGLTTIVGMMVFTHEFVMPTPDIQYDIRRLVSPDFDEFIMTKGYKSFSPAHRHYIENFEYTVNGLKRKQNQEYFGHFDTKEVN